MLCDMKRRIIVVLSTVALLAVSAVIAKYNRNDAFVYISILWFVACIPALWALPKSRARLVPLWVGAAILAFGLVEAYLAGWFPGRSREQSTRFERTALRGGHNRIHPILGYAPVKNSRLSVKKYHGDTLLYDVIYSIDANGLRTHPPSDNEPTSSVLFLGCSYTFGSGVQDAETMPFFFQQLSKGCFKAINLGYEGYGPHQMLAILEHELEENVVKYLPPEFAIYQAIPEHVGRCVGKNGYDLYGPKYVLNEDSNLIHIGPFHRYFVANFITGLTRSHVLRKSMFTPQEITLRDIELFVAIVEEAARLFEERHGGQFYVLLWPGDSDWYPELLSQLRACSVGLIEIEDILPDARENKARYRIRSPFENHPDPLTHKRIADYLLHFLRRH